MGEQTVKGLCFHIMSVGFFDSLNRRSANALRRLRLSILYSILYNIGSAARAAPMAAPHSAMRSASKTRNSSPTLQAWAKQPLEATGFSPS